MTTTFTSEDISCEGCANAIKKAVGGLPGVSEVSVDVEKQEITVSHQGAVTRDALASTLDKAGFSTVGQ
jgi:copper chaperone